MVFAEYSRAERVREADASPGTSIDGTRHGHRTVVRIRDEASVERTSRFDARSTPLADVQALLVGLAIRPGLDVTGAQKLRHREVGYGAPPLTAFRSFVLCDWHR